MGKKAKLGMALFLGLISVVYVSTAFAGGSAEPGSIDDPVVTKSYVDEQLYLLNQSMIEMVGNQQTGGTIAPIVVEELKAGDKLIGKAGTEIIVRTGIVVTYGEGSNGIPDVTGGVDIAIGKQVLLNHQLIIPRDDGRGIMVSSSNKSSVYVMIRGEYEIVKGS